MCPGKLERSVLLVHTRPDHVSLSSKLGDDETICLFSVDVLKKPGRDIFYRRTSRSPACVSSWLLECLLCLLSRLFLLAANNRYDGSLHGGAVRCSAAYPY